MGCTWSAHLATCCTSLTSWRGCSSRAAAHAQMEASLPVAKQPKSRGQPNHASCMHCIIRILSRPPSLPACVRYQDAVPSADVASQGVPVAGEGRPERHGGRAHAEDSYLASARRGAGERGCVPLQGPRCAHAWSPCAHGGRHSCRPSSGWTQCECCSCTAARA